MLNYEKRRKELELAVSHELVNLESSKTRFDRIAATHIFCSWNCSVYKSKHFYEKRNAHEQIIESEVKQIESLQARLKAIKYSRERDQAIAQ